MLHTYNDVFIPFFLSALHFLLSTSTSTFALVKARDMDVVTSLLFEEFLARRCDFRTFTGSRPHGWFMSVLLMSFRLYRRLCDLRAVWPVFVGVVAAIYLFELKLILCSVLRKPRIPSALAALFQARPGSFPGPRSP